MAYRTQTSAVIAPPPDDSDFLESESEHDASQSVVAYPHEMTEMEAELAAVVTPTTSQVTSTSVAHRLRPTPADKIMQMTHNFSFTYFRHPAPRADVLNRNGGREAAGLPSDPDTPQRYTTQVNHDGSTQTEAVPASIIAPHIPASANVHWFCVDSELVYLSFFEDWGPLNVAMFYRFCLHLHHLINSAQEESTASAEDVQDLHLILYTSSDPKQKANAALLAAMYAMVCGDVSPADAFHPISGLELLPFRDAGYGRADYYLTIQDILYGVQRAIQERLLDLMTFDLDEYETYEQVQNGDWNWITPNIIAFASPNDKEYVAELRERTNSNARPTTPGLRRPMNPTFLRTVQYFKSHNVKLVVRLNNPLYDSRVFEREGIEHVDMYFDDGSNPCEEIVRDFIARADDVISAGGVVAVHCKAGLGRTGVLIGAYLAYRHGFGAGESIGFMRIMRPGCVVGPQQHFMYQEVPKWIRWREQDDANSRLERALAKQRAELIGKRRFEEAVEEASTEDSATDADLSGGESNERKIKKLKKALEAPTTPKRNDDERKDDTIRMAKPTPCVGQPRKSPSPSRKRAAQALAPATVARMGGNGSLSTRPRVVSADSIRTSSTSSSIDAGVAASLSKTDFGINVDVHLQVNSDVNLPRPTPQGQTVSHVLAEGEHRKMQGKSEESKAAGEVNVVASQAYVKPPTSARQVSNRVAAEMDDALFVEGWKSPEPPSTYAQRMTQSSPQRPPAAPSTPTSPATPSGVNRASPQIRERFGLRDTGSNQNTPRSRKEAMEFASSSSHVTHSSSESLSSNGSLTSRDAPGSDDTTPTLQPGPLEKILTTEARSAPAAAPSSPTKGQPERATSRIASRPAAANGRTASNSSTSSTHRAGSSSRPQSSLASRKASGSHRTAAPSTSSTSTSVRRHASSAANSAGRVAAARERLTQKQATSIPPGTTTELAQRPSLKRPRVHAAETVQSKTNGVQGQTRAPSRAGVNGQSTRPALASAPSSTINSSVRQPSNGVPRFAMSTAASAAKSSAAPPSGGSMSKVHAGQGQLPLHGVSHRFGAYSRGAPHHIPLSSSSAATSATLAHLHGRNVHRRRSSLGEADIIM